MDDNAEKVLVVDFAEAIEWKEPSPSRLRKNMRQGLRDMLESRKYEAARAYMMHPSSRYEIFGIQDEAMVELDFRISSVSYNAGRVRFSQYTEKADFHSSALCVDHLAVNVYSDDAYRIMHIFFTPKEDKQSYKWLLRFIAACSLKARSVTPFVLPMIRSYENSMFTFQFYSRPLFGSVANIMRSLATLRANSRNRLETSESKDEARVNAVGSPLPPQYVLYFSACILQALQSLAEQGISLNRMSTESVMITHQQIPVLTDFLCANKCDPEFRYSLTRHLPDGLVADIEHGSSKERETGAASIVDGSSCVWLAPEFSQSSQMLGRVDVWNFGAFVLMMSVGTETFKHLRDSEHRTAVSQTGTVVSMQPCSQMAANNRPCGLVALGPDLLHLVSIAMAESPSRRPTLRILQCASFFSKVNFLNLIDQTGAFGIDLNELLRRATLPMEPQQQQQLPLAQPSASPSSAAHHSQMLDQITDADEVFDQLGVWTSMGNGPLISRPPTL